MRYGSKALENFCKNLIGISIPADNRDNFRVNL